MRAVVSGNTAWGEVADPELARDADAVVRAARRFVTHHFATDQFTEACEVFSHPRESGASKVVLAHELP
jgi:hypothetical protein